MRTKTLKQNDVLNIFQYVMEGNAVPATQPERYTLTVNSQTIHELPPNVKAIKVQWGNVWVSYKGEDFVLRIDEALHFMGDSEFASVTAISDQSSRVELILG
jgi:hypothetical protein